MKSKINNILTDIQPIYDFDKSSDFLKDGYLDSLDIVTLVADLEAEFSILISALDMVPENFSSLDSICALIEKSEKV